MATINRSALKRNNAATLLNKIKESNTKTYEQDERLWQPAVDQNGNGFAVIRFMPARTEDSLPYIKQYNHGFKVNEKWFINLCPTTIGLDSPAVEYCNELWNSGYEADKKVARERKRKLRYFANVMIIKDPKNPENEGKIKIMQFGQKIFEKLMNVMNPPEEFGEEPRDPFGFFDGCVMKLKIRKKDGFRNYDESTVDPAEDLFGGDEDQLMAVLEQLHDIDALNAPEKFKDYATLHKELYRVLGDNIAAEGSPVQDKWNEQKNSSSESTREYGAAQRQQPARQEQRAPERVQSQEPVSQVSDDGDDDLAMFAAIANDD